MTHEMLKEENDERGTAAHYVGEGEVHPTEGQGRYKGGTSAGGKSKTKRRKIGGGPSATEHVKVITTDGKIR